MHKLFCIMGRSASGKTSIVKEICRRNHMKMLQSYTTRPRRVDDDLDFHDHIFISKEEVEKYINDMVAYTKIGEYEYFATVQQLQDVDFYVIDPPGYKELVSGRWPCMKDIEVIPIYISCEKTIMEERAKERGQDMEKWLQRYNDEDERFTEFEKKMLADCHVVYNNSDFDRVVNGMDWIIKQCFNEEKSV